MKIKQAKEDYYTGHHIWCNYSGSRKAEDCTCKKLHEEYPMNVTPDELNNLTPDELIDKYFPNVIKRT